MVLIFSHTSDLKSVRSKTALDLLAGTIPGPPRYLDGGQTSGA